jgi:RNA polymerase sigma-70 factor, ECF subfamily
MHSCGRRGGAATAAVLQDTIFNQGDADVQAAIAGDASAFARVIEANEGMMDRVCRTILRCEADCADAVQDTVIMAWNRIGQLRNPASGPAWLARICINRCYRLARRNRKPESLYEPVILDNHDETRMDILSAVHSLPEELRLTVVFYYFEDWSIEDISRAQGTFQGTVKSRLHRARRLLAAALKDYREVSSDDTQ